MANKFNEYADSFRILDNIEKSQTVTDNIFALTFSSNIDLPRLEQAICKYVNDFQTAVLNDSKLFSYKITKLKGLKPKTKVIFRFHQCVSDAAMVRSFIKILAELYNQGHSSYQSSDFVSSYDETEDRAYWQQLLQGKNFVVDFHHETPGFVQGIRSKHFQLSKQCSQKLRKFCWHNKTTTFIVLSAVLSCLINRYTQQRDFGLLYPIDMRPVENKALLGCYINSALMTVNLEENMRFSELLLQLQTQRKQTKLHQKLPFHKLVQYLRHQQVIQNPVIANVAIAESLLKYEPEINFVGADFTYQWMPTDIAGEILLVYDASLDNICFRLDSKKSFPTFFNEQFSSGFLNLLNFFIQHPDEALLKAPLLSPQDERLILQQWNNTALKIANQQPAHRQFELQAKKSPELVALIFEEQVLTYRQLNESANALANSILQQIDFGDRVDRIIPICAQRSLDLFIGILAILKTGAGYLPIDSNWPIVKIKTILSEVDAPFVLCQGQFKNLFADKVIEIRQAADQQDISNPLVNLSSEHLAYIIYTSGSTGQPKGVMVRHGNLINHLNWIQNTYRLTAHDRVLHKTPYTFDVSVWEILWPLTAGATVVIAQPDAHKSPQALYEIIYKQSVTTLHFVGSMALAFIESMARKKPVLHTVRNVFLGGELITSRMKKRVGHVFKDAKISVFYGPTETTIESTYAICNKDNVKYDGLIGRPIANTACYILDEYQNPVPIGVIGELYIGGAGVAKGYLNQVDLTAEKFMANPFVEQQEYFNKRLYKTGDLVRWLPDGNIVYVGRKDFQVKLRGQRIELGEIESRLAEHFHVRQAAVAVKGSLQNEYLVGYYTSDQVLLSEELQQFLRQALPEYMVPHVYVRLDEMPLLNNGKLDRKALPVVDFGCKMNHMPLLTPTEVILATLWQKVLNVEVNDRYANFFAQGGHSLAAIKLSHEINKAFGLNLVANFVFEHKTLIDQAYVIAANKIKKYKAIIPLKQSSQAMRKLFLVHPGQAGVEVYRSWLPYLSDDISVYGIDSYNLYHWQRPIQSLKALAKHYLKALKKVQAKGPYELGGWSLGGLIAYEMALQLHVRGEQVSQLYLIDSFMLADVEQNSLNLYHMAHETSQKLIYDSQNFSAEMRDREIKLLNIEQQMVKNYQPVKYDGEVTLWNAVAMNNFGKILYDYPACSAAIHRLKENANGWKPYLSKLHEIKLDVDHYQLMKEASAVEKIVRLINDLS